MNSAWFVAFGLLCLAIFVWALRASRTLGMRETWGYGSQYGGPEFGIPLGWPRERSAVTREHGPYAEQPAERRRAEDGR